MGITGPAEQAWRKVELSIQRYGFSSMTPQEVSSLPSLSLKSIPSDKRSAPIDEIWLHVMLAAIGETLENNDDDGEVMGVVVNVRKGFYRVGLWTKTVGKSVPGGGEGDVAGGKGRSIEKSKEVLMGLGRKFKEVLKLKDAEVVEFSGHTESAHSGSTRAKAKFTV